jgi:phenylpropionate dioxygenase-like ring-hydroxylating dioxygenase large terminal subunit
MTPAPSALFSDAPGEFLVGRDVYRDPQVFDWEMRHVFEGTWNLLGLASQAPRPHDFFTTTLGRSPVIVSRDAQGRLHCLVNSCRHKGALVCHQERGSARNFVCRYHGWAYDTSGRNILVKDREQGAYGECFDRQSHDLQAVPRFGEYRGLLFASLNTEVPPLEEYLGDVRRMIDLVVDQSPHGVECVPGTTTFTFEGNWKLQMENGVDPYHFSTTHPSYIQALQRREGQGSVYAGFRSRALERGTFAFAHGHNAMWGPSPSADAAPLAQLREELLARVGEVKRRWMGYVRNTTLFPNAQFAENASLQLRIWRPLAVDRTEMRTFCIAPVGEPAAARTQRIRQYEEFFNPTGLATPDDIANYEDCQRGLGARAVRWQQGTARGEAARAAGASHPAAAELGIRPLATVVGPFDMGDETVMQHTWRYWRELIERGQQRDAAGAAHG